MVAGIGTIANKGTYIKPHVVKQVINSKTGEITDIPIEKEENVLSKKTAEDVLSMMETVVAQGTRKKCASSRI